MAKKPVLEKPSRQFNITEIRRLENFEEEISQGLVSFLKVGTALKEIRDRGLYFYRAKSWDDYIRLVWPQKITKRSADRLISAAKTAEGLDGMDVKLLPPQGTNDVDPGVAVTPPEQWTIGKNAEIQQQALILLGKLDTDAERADVLAKAAAHVKPKPNGLVITAAAVRRAMKDGQSEAPASDPGDVEADEPEVVDETPEEVMARHNSEIESFCRQLQKTFDDRTAELEKENGWISDMDRLGSARQQIRNALKAVRSAKGAALCFDCGGDGCKSCYHTGHIDRMRYQQGT